MRAEPGVFFRFYREKTPLAFETLNITHRILAKWEQEESPCGGHPNIDGRHQKAVERSRELHGSVPRNYCRPAAAKVLYSAEFVKNAPGIPPSAAAAALSKPDVVLYEESLDEQTIAGSVKAIQSADMLIVAGTSLTVYPAAGLINYYGQPGWCSSWGRDTL